VLPILPLSDEIIDRAVSLRQKKKMSLGDALIASRGVDSPRQYGNGKC